MSILYRIISTFYPLMVVILALIMNYATLKTILLLYIVFCFYINITAKTQLRYKQTVISNKIINFTKILQNTKFKPFFFLPTALMQTIFFPFLKGPPVEIEINREPLNNFGTSLDWATIKGNVTVDNSQCSVLLLVPGLAGTKEDTYILNMSYEGIKNNFVVAIYHSRLLSDNLSLPEDCYLNLFDDFELALNSIEKKYPNSKIYGIGFSYGSNLLTNYLGTRNVSKKRIVAGVSIANPFNMLICQKFLSDTIYDYIILDILKTHLKKHIPNLKKHKTLKLDLEKAEKCNSLKEFDEYIIRRVLGYKNSDDYYREISCVHNIKKINIPLLCINSLDDGITTSKAIPYDDISMNENIFLLTTTRGGHLTWIDNSSFFKLNQWINNPAIDFLNAIKLLD